MTRTPKARSPSGTNPIETIQNRAGRKRLALQRIFACLPAQIDAIKDERERAAIELRRFMMVREADETTRQRNAASHKYPAISVSASP